MNYIMAALAAIFLLSKPAAAFLLISQDYRLATPSTTKVNIASGACRANSMSDDELNTAIDDVLKRYWNTVSESRLRLERGIEVGRSISGHADPGEILIGCLPLGMSAASGVTTPNPSETGSKITLNGTTLIPGGYYYEGLVGLIAHEMGHAIGLHHSGDAASVMTYESHNWGASPKYLSQDDKNGVVYLYPNESETYGILGACARQVDAAPLHGSRSHSGPIYLLELVVIFLGIRLSSRLFKRNSA